MGLYAEIITSVENACNAYITQNVIAVANGIKDPAFTLLAVYVLFWGFSHMMNKIQEPITDSIIRFIKIFFIFGIAFQMAAFNTYIVDTITNGPEQIAQLLTGASTETQIVNSLDQIFKDTWNIGTGYWDNAGVLDNFGFFFVAIVVYLIACLLSAYAAFLIILSKIAIAVLVALGPLFIIATLFNTTKRFFENWVGMLANYGMVIVLAIGVNSFILSLFRNYLSKINAGQDLEVVAVAPIMVTAIISIFILTQVLSMASGLGGGISLATMGAGRWASSKMMSGAGAAGLAAQALGVTATTKARNAVASWMNRGSVSKS